MGRHLSITVEDNPRPACARVAQSKTACEPGIVRLHSAAAHENCVVLLADREALLPCSIRGDPLTVARHSGHLPVEGDRCLEEDERHLLTDGPRELLVETSRFKLTDTRDDVDSCRTQGRDATAIH